MTEYRLDQPEQAELAASPRASSDYRLAQALVGALQALIPDYEVGLVADPRADRKSITKLRILVRPASWTQQAATRAYDEDQREVHVGVVGPCRAADMITLDAALSLCDRIRALWGCGGMLRDAVVCDEYQPTGTLKQQPLFDEQTLMQDNLFVANITLTYHRTN
jgi:hypothetical protein